MLPETVLNQYWGYSQFRPFQKDIIQSILDGNDTFALLPTGGGKSICFQVPALLLPGLTLVISPLISLMKDQVDALSSKSIAATYLASADTKSEQAQKLSDITHGKYTLVYLSPERLQNPHFINQIKSLPLSLIVVDEAHCVSVWGHDFRPPYQMISQFISQLSTRPIVAAFTATATDYTRQDIIHSLSLKNASVFSSSFKRNISISIDHVATQTERELQLLAYLQVHCHQAGIIYVATQHQAESLSQRLNDVQQLLGLGKVGCYHGGLPHDQRQTTQHLFLDNSLQLLVATTAFGMGIDKPNIEFVVHFQPSASIENYFQEIGRAGRGGQAAEAKMFLLEDDFSIQQSLINKAENPSKVAQHKLEAFKHFTATSNCRMKHLLQYFGQEEAPCGQCDNCSKMLSPLQTILNEKKHYLQTILKWRNVTAKKYSMKEQYVLQNQQACYLTLFKIENLDHLKVIPGLGSGWLNLWGKSLLGAVIQ